MREHTPGPWGACQEAQCKCGFIWDASGEIHVASVHGEYALGATYYGSDVAVAEGVRIANTRLIAAAPDMLEALKIIRVIADPVAHAGLCRGCGNVSAEAAAAIAKAVGRS